MQSAAKSAIHNLSGLRTADGWVIGDLVTKAVYQTGGAFSTGYLVTHEDGRPGFLKALDFSIAQRAADKMAALESLTRSYNFEKNVLNLCRGENLSKVVVAISDGSIAVPEAPFGEVFYLIFELADGDIRKKIVTSDVFDAAWVCRSLHHIAVGISQLHSHGIFHQDIKPSNILVFDTDDVSKVADLGRSHCATIDAPHDIMSMPGARSYAPPEQLYNFELPDRSLARAAADVYLLGSMAFFLFTGVMLTPFVVDRLRAEHRPPVLSADDGGWRGYFEDVLPYLRSAYGEAVEEFRAAVATRFDAAVEPALGDELVALFIYLTEPNPVERGHPLEKAQAHGNHFALRRFVSVLNRIASRLEFKLKRPDAKAA